MLIEVQDRKNNVLNKIPKNAINFLDKIINVKKNTFF